MPVRGRVKWFNNEKGYGFIEQDDGGDVFAHYKSILDDSPYKVLKKGDLVEFEVEESEKGPKAIQINRVED